MWLTFLLITLQAGLLMARESNSGCKGGCPELYECQRTTLCNDPQGCTAGQGEPHYSCVQTAVLCDDPYGCS